MEAKPAKKRKSTYKITTPYVDAALKYMIDHNEFNPLTLLTETAPEMLGSSAQGAIVKSIKHNTVYIKGLYAAYCRTIKKLDEKAPRRTLYEDLDEEVQVMLSRLREIAETGGAGNVSACKEYLDRIEAQRKHEEIPEEVVVEARHMAERLLRTAEATFCQVCRPKYSDLVTSIMEEIGQ